MTAKAARKTAHMYGTPIYVSERGKLLASNRVTQQPSAKAELDSLRSIVARCFSDVTAKGLSTDARFIMAYDAARTLSVMIVRAAGYRPSGERRAEFGLF